MDKEEVMRLHEELNELSAFEEQNLERMVEIAKILNAYYMRWKTENKSNVKTAESELRWKCEEKRIEMKMWRELCIKCTNQKYRESQAALRKARQQK